MKRGFYKKSLELSITENDKTRGGGGGGGGIFDLSYTAEWGDSAFAALTYLWITTDFIGAAGCFHIDTTSLQKI